MSQIEEQLVDSSRMIADMVIAYVGDDQDKFDEVVRIMEQDEYPMAMRAARVAYFVSEKHPVLIRKHIPDFIKMLSKTKVDGIKRCVLKLLADTTIRIPEEEMGELADIAFCYVQNSQEPVAVRACGIEVLEKIARYYPELNNEIISVLESIYLESSTSLRGRCKKAIKKLSKKII